MVALRGSRYYLNRFYGRADADFQARSSKVFQEVPLFGFASFLEVVVQEPDDHGSVKECT